MELARKNIRNLKPYRSARDDYSKGILLDANENSFGAPFQNTLMLNRYPDPYQNKLRALIAGYREVEKQQVFTGVGSDEAIDLLIRIFCEPQLDHIVTCPPTYGMYEVAASINNVEVLPVLLDEQFDIIPEQIISDAGNHSKLLFLCSPNNPTGNCLSEDRVLEVAEHFPGMVVIDEAYIDFAAHPGYAQWVTKYPNLVITQTLSKAFGLAGIRLGIAIAHPQVIELMMKIKAPYNVNKLTAETAMKALKKSEVVEENVARITEERKQLVNNLESLENVINIYPSDANFLLVKMDNALEKYKKLAEMGVIVRYRGNEPLCENSLRITVGTPDENKQLIDALRKISA